MFTICNQIIAFILVFCYFNRCLSYIYMCCFISMIPFFRQNLLDWFNVFYHPVGGTKA